MELLPKIESFLDLVATVLVAITILFTVFALFENRKATRLAALLLVAALALYSDAFGTYFAAVFIVATAVTELEFLEKLAAIIRGSKEYFDYKKSQVPVEEVKAKAREEVAAVETPSLPSRVPEQAPNIHDGLERNNTEEELNRQTEAPKQLMPSGDAASIGYAIEQLALTYFERRLGTPIQRNMRFSTPRADVEFDGIVERGNGRSDTLIEIKLASEHTIESTARRGAKEFMKRQETFKEMTGRRATGILILVVPDKSKAGEHVSLLKAQVQEMSHTLQLEIIDFKDIGYTS